MKGKGNEERTSFYEEIAQGYNELYGEEQRRKAEVIRRCIKLQGLLLDIGAGTGIATKVFEGTTLCVKLEPSLALLKQAGGVRVCGVAEELPFKSNVFDSILSLTALHHCDIPKALREMKRVMKEEGHIAISILKKARKGKELERSFREYVQIDEGKDIIFLR